MNARAHGTIAPSMGIALTNHQDMIAVVKKIMSTLVRMKIKPQEEYAFTEVSSLVVESME